MICPFHVLISTADHASTPILRKAIAYHSAVRAAQPTFGVNGMFPRAECYPLFEAEIKVPDDPSRTLDEALLDELLEFESNSTSLLAANHHRFINTTDSAIGR